MGVEAFRKARRAALAMRAESAHAPGEAHVTKPADQPADKQPSLPLAPPPAVPAQPQGPTSEEFATLRAKLAEFEASETKARAKIDELEQDRKRIADAHNRERIRFTALNIAEKLGAISAEQVVRLVGDDLSLTEKGEVVLSSDPKVGVEAHLRTFLETNAHFRKPEVHPGGGTKPFPSPAPGGDAAKPDLTTDAGRTEYARRLTHQAVSPPTTTTASRGPERVN